MPTKQPRINVTKDAALAAAISRVRPIMAGAPEATIVHDLAIRGAAAAAAEAGLGVLHYEADFDTLATVLPFESRWIAPRGSLD